MVKHPLEGIDFALGGKKAHFAGDILVLVKYDTFVLGERILALDIPDELQADIVD